MASNNRRQFSTTSSGGEKYIEECLTISKELHEYFTEKSLTTMNQDLKRHLVYVATNSNEVTGFATIHKKSNYVAEISWMAVKSEQQRQGIGSALIDHVANDLRSQGIKVLEVKTLSADVDYFPYEKTRRFYNKMGFMHLETIDPFPGWEQGNPCAIYVKIL